MTRYQFALVRYVHDITAEEFVNVGVVMLEVDARRLLFRISDRYGRVSEFFGGINGAAFRTMVRQAERAVERVDAMMRQPGLLEESPDTLEGALALAFPQENSSVRASQVMSGVSDEPERRLDALYDEFVRRYESPEGRDRRDEADVRRDLNRRIAQSGLTARVRFDVPIEGANYSHSFQAEWRNGKQQVLDPISLDLVDATRIVEKANTWSGRLYNLARGADFQFTGVVVPPRDPVLTRAFDSALAILRGSQSVRRVILEGESEQVLQMIREDTASRS